MEGTATEVGGADATGDVQIKGAKGECKAGADTAIQIKASADATVTLMLFELLH
jgi:hypothetical protein